MKFIDQNFAVHGQINPDDITTLKQNDFHVVINNRPDNESFNQPTSDSIKSACEKHGIEYYWIPVSGLNMSHVQQFKEIEPQLKNKKVFAFCASGNRAAMLYQAAKSN